MVWLLSRAPAIRMGAAIGITGCPGIYYKKMRAYFKLPSINEQGEISKTDVKLISTVFTACL